MAVLILIKRRFSFPFSAGWIVQVVQAANATLESVLWWTLLSLLEGFNGHQIGGRIAFEWLEILKRVFIVILSTLIKVFGVRSA
jgi:hypothetical protein